MKSLKMIKEVLKKNGATVDFLDKDFFDIFTKDFKEACDKEFDSDAKSFLNTMETDFYKKNGSSYCEFLQEFYDNLPEYRIDFFKEFIDIVPCKRFYRTHEDKEKLIEMANLYAQKNKYVYEINTVCL